MNNTFDPHAAAELLLAARHSSLPIAAARITPPDRAGAFAVQAATLAALGPHAGWKVGAKGTGDEPIAAPLPARGVWRSPATLPGPAARWRAVEVELALVLGDDASVAFCCVAIEIVQTRLLDRSSAPALAALADLQSHGALVVGPHVAIAKGQALPDLRTLRAQLELDGRVVAEACGGNPALDVGRLLRWLTEHARRQGLPLAAGQVLSTGSCTGLVTVPAGTRVRGTIEGFGEVLVQL